MPPTIRRPTTDDRGSRPRDTTRRDMRCETDGSFLFQAVDGLEEADAEERRTIITHDNGRAGRHRFACLATTRAWFTFQSSALYGAMLSNHTGCNCSLSAWNDDFHLPFFNLLLSLFLFLFLINMSLSFVHVSSSLADIRFLRSAVRSKDPVLIDM